MAYGSTKTSPRTKPCTSATTSCGSTEYGIRGTVTPCSSTTTSRDSTKFTSISSSTTTNNATDTRNTSDPQDPQGPRDPQGSQGSRDTQDTQDTKDPQGSRDSKDPRNDKDTRDAMKAIMNRRIEARRVVEGIWVRIAKENGVNSDTVNGNPFAESSSTASTGTAKDSTCPISVANSSKDSKSGSKASSTPNTAKSNKSDQSTAPPALLPLDHEKVKKWAGEHQGSGEEDVDPTEESDKNEYIGEAHKPAEESDRSEYNGVANQPIEEKYRGKVESSIVSDCSNSDGGVEL
ncbi:hypothetical protein FIE12Z_1004 [Fusarium flagelliforme]|uniref:Uncharacterized protein n=1 Tax=Fusarium flagelliforme TaxID=2675880 RepID=A0A395N4X3_9HYPO|nr:hypothetical protein FIE12Z_1004 [Fusarium flagelliforme]